MAITDAEIQSVFAARLAHPDHLIWRGATSTGKPGHPILFDAHLRAAFMDLSGDNGAAAIVRAHPDQTYLVSFSDDRARLDLDTPEDWDRWRRSSI